MDRALARKILSFFSRLRTWTALASTFLLNLGMFGIKFRKACSPGFVCHGCPWGTFACPVGVSAFSSAMGRIPAFAISSVLLIGALLGRLMCGFVCPFGFLQDILFKIRTKKYVLPRWTRYIKYAALVLLVFTFPYFTGFKAKGYVQVESASVDRKNNEKLGVTVTLRNPGTMPLEAPEIKIMYRGRNGGKEIEGFSRSFKEVVGPGSSVALPEIIIPDRLKDADMVIASPQSTVEQDPRYSFLYYCKLCPAGTLTATLPSYFTPLEAGQMAIYRGHAVRFIILIFFIVLMILVSRPFCQTFCPLGALYALASPFSLLRMNLDRDACIDCGACDRVCPVNLDVRREIGGMECIACGDCQTICPKKAITRSTAR